MGRKRRGVGRSVACRRALVQSQHLVAATLVAAA